MCGVFLNAIFLDHLDADVDHLQRMNQDLALVAEAHAHRMPSVVRYVLEGLGPPDAQGADLMSRLLFVIDIGYGDTSARIDEIEAFIRADGDRSVQLSVR